MKTKINVKMIMVLFFSLLFVQTKAQISDKLSIKGFASFEYEYSTSDKGPGDKNGSFDTDGLDLVFNFDLTNRLRFATDIAFEHGAVSEEAKGNIAVEYFFPEYTVYNWLKFRAGKMLTPIGLYNEIHVAKPAFLAVKEPLSTNKPLKFGGKNDYYPRWNGGIAVLGDFELASIGFDYHLQISNGIQNTVEGYNLYEEDGNTQKAITFRLRSTPIQGLRIGAAVYKDDIVEVDEIDVSTDYNTKIFTYDFTAEYSYKNAGFELEYINSKVTPSEKVVNVNNFQKSRQYGFETMVYYTFKDRFTPYFRIEYYDYDQQETSDDKVNIYSVGLNSQITNAFFLKLQYNYGVHNELAAKYEGITYSQFQAALAIGF